MVWAVPPLWIPLAVLLYVGVPPPPELGNQNLQATMAPRESSSMLQTNHCHKLCKGITAPWCRSSPPWQTQQGSTQGVLKDEHGPRVIPPEETWLPNTVKSCSQNPAHSAALKLSCTTTLRNQKATGKKSLVMNFLFCQNICQAGNDTGARAGKCSGNRSVLFRLSAKKNMHLKV